MPTFEGEKWACASCIKGHRVSGCTHTDRELHHINPKGRPVKQCEHCRGARKSKSHHAKCDCGDKKDKPKDKGDLKVGGHHCGCHSGAACTCGIVKKESLDLKLDTGTLKLAQHPAKPKPRLTATQSESTLTVFANGHHKPCHRLNNAAHVSGAPYKIPRPHTLHDPLGHYSHDNLKRIYEQPNNQAQRSLDTLSLSNSSFYSVFSSPAQRSVDSLPLTSSSGMFNGTYAPFDPQKPMFAKAPENGLPHVPHDGSSPDSQLSDTIPSQTPWAWTPTTASGNGTFGLDSLSTSPSQEYLPALENDWAIPSAGINPSWSAKDLPLVPNRSANAFPISQSGESNKQSVPNLTPSSSGAQSEIGDPNMFENLEYAAPQSVMSESLPWDESAQFRDPPAYRMRAATGGSDFRQAPTSAPGNDARRSLDIDFNKRFNESLLEQGVNSNFMPFQSPNIEASKGMSAAPTYASTSAPVDANSLYSTDEYAPRSIMIPNSIEDIPTSNPWLGFDDVTNFGLTSFDTPLDMSVDVSNYSASGPWI
ncbi:hypothetical protein BU16DRAFT_562186 [Lophium mytilinum]|uniref:Copper-fist domain-containing protein n=1 Tax=Lophium mytilinum TaxID=390894 RepID=A0A6A6QQV5_9PEZI|nr:hypothetical protein BU16DRAFT_562186 [Lophium mytilinum]